MTDLLGIAGVAVLFVVMGLVRRSRGFPAAHEDCARASDCSACSARHATINTSESTNAHS